MTPEPTETADGPSERTRPEPPPLPPSELPPELAEERRVSGAGPVEAVNAALLALSRAARAFLLYEPNNATIRHFIEDLRGKFTKAVEAAGVLDLEVRPFELALAGTVVYVEPDRERSLAFRLFRDGVRRLLIRPAVRWEEVLRLLEVLSIRYTGIRQSEDDVVTLLRKADFSNIEIGVIEGFVPEEEEAPADASAPATATLPAGVTLEPGAAASGTSARDVPADWDLPPRPLEDLAPLEWREVAADVRAALVAEEADERFAENAVLAARGLIDLHGDEATSVGGAAELLPFVHEVRDFLLAEGHIAGLVQLVRALYDTMRTVPMISAPLLRTFGERSVLRRLVLFVARDQLKPPDDMLVFLDLVPSDHLATLFDLLGEEAADEASRRIMRQLVERYAADRADYLLARLRESPPRVACDLLRACARAVPERAVDAALELAGHDDPAVVHEALRRFEKAPPNPRVSRTLAELLASPHEDIRLRALDLLSRRRERAAFSSVAEYAEGRAAVSLSSREAELIGRTLARLSPDGALNLFEGWLRPKGLVGRLVGGAGVPSVAWVVVAGLGALGGPEAARLLRELSEKAEGDLRRRVLGALSRSEGHGGDQASGDHDG